MKRIKYQMEAVGKLVNETIDLLKLSTDRNVLVFEAPTGSGKTVMASEMLLRLSNELRVNPGAPVSEVAYIWIAPNRLHEQSYFKMKNFFTETKELRPVIYDEIDHSGGGSIRPGEILFVNWESINKDNAVLVRETEQSASLYDLTRRTQEQYGIPIVAIIDEEHMFGGRSAKKSEKVLQNIRPKVEIRISATPLPETKHRASATVRVPRERVIGEQMIKETVIINPGLLFNPNLTSLNQQLISIALKKREELAEAYRKVGAGINPLLLIQLPNDGDGMSAEDNSIKEEVIEYLDKIKGITVQNYKLGIWLSNEKTENLKGIVGNDDMTEVLLFKQAIALGWDCPRASVLLIFRDIKSHVFGVQTVGRILRMPEQKFYTDPRLNVGYVYTNLSTDFIEVRPEDADYLAKYVEARCRENLKNVALVSEYDERLAVERNRLGYDFRSYLLETFEQHWSIEGCGSDLFSALEEGEPAGKKGTSGDGGQNDQFKNREIAKKNYNINFSVSSISVEIIEDLEITGEVKQTLVRNKAKYVRTVQELERVFMAYCYLQLQLSAHSTGIQYEKVSIKTLAGALKDVMADLFGLFDTEAVKVILYRDNNYGNKFRFPEVVQAALDVYARVLKARQKQAKQKDYRKNLWAVPDARLYKADTHEANPEVENHALLPFFHLKDRSNPEKEFEEFLEENRDSIDWWYKNGDHGKQHYSIGYVNKEGDKALFYVDFIIRMKNGQIFLFDTKSADSDSNASQKHNALIDYMASDENKDRHLRGGIIIHHGENWKYSPLYIENTTDLTGWDTFVPSDYR